MFILTREQMMSPFIGLLNGENHPFTNEDADILRQAANRISLQCTVPITPGTSKLGDLIVRYNIEERWEHDYVTADGWGANHQPGGIIVSRQRSKIIEVPMSACTNNLRELTALSFAVNYAADMNVKTIYTDSDTILSWIEKQSVKTVDDKDKALNLVRDITSIIINNNITIKKWRTDVWGQIPSDAGRK